MTLEKDINHLMTCMRGWGAPKMTARLMDTNYRMREGKWEASGNKLRPDWFRDLTKGRTIGVQLVHTCILAEIGRMTLETQMQLIAKRRGMAMQEDIVQSIARIDDDELRGLAEAGIQT